MKHAKLLEPFMLGSLYMRNCMDCMDHLWQQQPIICPENPALDKA